MPQHTHCIRCGHRLTSPRSRTLGYGPTCATRIRRAATADHSSTQQELARELIEDGGIIPVRTSRVGTVYATVSTDGTKIHRTTTGHCTCPAGHAGQRCYHTAAALLLAA